MRITSKQYAEGLYESVRHAEPSDRTGIFDRFFSILIRERRMKDMPTILSALRRIIERETGEKSVRTRSAHPLSESAVRNLRERLCKIFDVDRVALETMVDPHLAGGIMIETEDETLDASILGALRQMKTALRESK